MPSDRKQICSRAGMSTNYGEACKERFNSLRSASFEVVCSPPCAPQICFQMCLVINGPPVFLMYALFIHILTKLQFLYIVLLTYSPIV